MSRIRQIKPAFFKHADLYDAEVSSGLPLRIAFAGLWTVADKRGVFEWSRNLKPDVVPYDPCDMLAVLDALAAAGFVQRYEVEGRRYGVIPNFAHHQHFHRDEKVSRLPAPPEQGAPETSPPSEHGASTVLARGEHPASTPSSQVVRYSGNGKKDPHVPPDGGTGAPGYPAEFEAVWSLYPRRTGGNSKKDAFAAWKARRRSGVPAEVLHGGVERYAAFCAAEGTAGSRFVMMAASFFGTGEHYLEPWIAGPAQAPTIRLLDKAASDLWTRYRSAQLLTSWPRAELERIGAQLVEQGCYPDLAAFLDEMRRTRPWELADARTDAYAIGELTRRLGRAS